MHRSSFYYFSYLDVILDFLKTERQKTELLYEIANLNSKVTTLVDEKNAVMALSGTKKAAPLKQTVNATPSQQDVKNKMSRFVKLIQVDEKYKFTKVNFEMKPEEQLSLKELVTRFINFSASNLGLFYTEKTVSTFLLVWQHLKQ